jgi:hypothetical protein
MRCDALYLLISARGIFVQCKGYALRPNHFSSSNKKNATVSNPANKPIIIEIFIGYSLKIAGNRKIR